MKNFLYVVLIVGSLFVSLCRGLFVDEQAAIKALDDAGYSNVEVVDRAWFAVPLRGGSESDAARFEARVTNPAGKKVTIYVFVGWPFKGSTVRSL